MGYLQGSIYLKHLACSVELRLRLLFKPFIGRGRERKRRRDRVKVIPKIQGKLSQTTLVLSLDGACGSFALCWLKKKVWPRPNQSLSKGLLSKFFFNKLSINLINLFSNRFNRLPSSTPDSTSCGFNNKSLKPATVRLWYGSTAS